MGAGGARKVLSEPGGAYRHRLQPRRYAFETEHGEVAVCAKFRIVPC